MQSSLEPYIGLIVFIVYIIRMFAKAISRPSPTKQTIRSNTNVTKGQFLAPTPQRVALVNSTDNKVRRDLNAGVRSPNQDRTSRDVTANDPWKNIESEKETNTSSLSEQARLEVPADSSPSGSSTRSGLKRMLTGNSLLGAIIMAEVLTPRNGAGFSRGAHSNATKNTQHQLGD